MNRIAKITAVTLVASAVGLGVAQASGWGDKCERHQHGGYNPERAAMMQHKQKHQRAPLDLTAEEVKVLAQARLIMRGNDRLAVGEVAPVDEQTYKVQIVTVDGSLVKEITVDKDQGFRHQHKAYKAF